MKTGKKFLTVQEVADYFGVNPATVYRKARAGELPVVKFGRKWLFPGESLDEWVSQKISKKPPIDISSDLENLNSLHLVYLFGSMAEGFNNPLSDIDIAYLDDGSVSPFDFEVEIEACIRKLYPNAKRIDLVRLNEAPVTISYRVIKTGTLIHAISDDARAAFEERTVMDFLDYSPLRKMFFREAA